MSLFQHIKDSLIHLAFPHVCEGCGSDHISKDHMLCLKCLADLPSTNFHLHASNPVERIFWGRLPLCHATSQYYFTKESMMQHLLHSLKYKNNKEIGLYLGRLMGQAFTNSHRFSFIDALIPLPLHKYREHKRGYNQAALLCQGIATVIAKPVLWNIVVRTEATSTQTKKTRAQRWQNIEGKFELIKPDLIKGKHVLLVDDVVTTGATLEACGRELLKCENLQLSIATLCFSFH